MCDNEENRRVSERTVAGLIEAINATTTMPELDALRGDAAALLTVNGKESFDRIQGAFRQAKRRLRRVPLRDRKGW